MVKSQNKSIGSRERNSGLVESKEEFVSVQPPEIVVLSLARLIKADSPHCSTKTR